MYSCSKCRSDNLNLNYVRNRQLIDSSSTRKVDTEFIRSSEYDFFYQLTANKEHMKYDCNNCGYSDRVNIITDED